MYYSYVLGIDNRIMELASQGFDIQNDGDNFMVSFPEEKSEVWEGFIRQYLELGYWNEYLNNEKVVFIFKFEDGEIKKYVLDDCNQGEILQLCCKFAEYEFESIKEMLFENEFYKEKFMDNLVSSLRKGVSIQIKNQS